MGWSVAAKDVAPLATLLQSRIDASVLGNPHALHPTPHTLHPTPYTLLPTPYSLLPTPYSLLPGPYTLLPGPYTVLLTTPNPKL